MSARERLQDMVRTERGDMNVYSQPEVRAAVDALRAEHLNEAADVAEDMYANGINGMRIAKRLRAMASPAAAPVPVKTAGDCTCIHTPEVDAGQTLHASYCVAAIRRSPKPTGGAS